MKATEFILDTVKDIKSWSSINTNSLLVLRMNYLVDTTSSPLTLTIPAANKMGDQIILKDQGDTFAVNNVTLSSTDNIVGSSNDYVLNVSGETIVLIYVDSSFGWQVLEPKMDAIKNITIDETGIDNGYMLRYNEAQKKFEWKPRKPVTAAPVLSGDSSVTELNSIEITIDNYDPNFVYNVSVPVGSYSRTGDTITWTVPEVSEDYSYEIKVTATSIGGLPNVTSKSVIVKNIPEINGPTYGTEQTVINFTIANYKSSGYTYNITVTGGTVSRTDDNITWTLPEVTDDTNMTLTISGTGAGGTTSNDYTITVKDSASVSGPNTKAEDLIANITIDDYDATKYTYDVTVTGGTFQRTDANIAWTLPEVTVDTNYTLTVIQHQAGFPDISTDHVILVQNVPVVPDTALVVEDTGFNGFIEEGEDYSIGSVNALSDTAWAMTVPELQDSGESDFKQQQPLIDVTTKTFNVKSGSTTSSLILDDDSTGINDFLVKYSGNDLTSMDSNINSQSKEFGDPVFGSENVFNSGVSISSILLDNTHVMISYRDGGDNSNYGKSIIGTINGTSITWGNPSVFNNGTTYYISSIILDDTHVMISYEDNSNSSYGTSIIGTINGTSITWGNESVFNYGTTTYISSILLDNTHVMISYEDHSNSDYGTSIIGTWDISAEQSIFGLNDAIPQNLISVTQPSQNIIHQDLDESFIVVDTDIMKTTGVLIGDSGDLCDVKIKSIDSDDNDYIVSRVEVDFMNN